MTVRGEESVTGTGAELARVTWIRLIRAGAPANLAGIVVVFLFILLLGGGLVDPDERVPAVVSGVGVLIYLAVGFPVGIAWRRRRYAPVERWLRAERPATDAEREFILRQPMQGVITSAPFWVFAAVLFAALSVRWSTAFAALVGVAILLGGATTNALIYLLHERVFRSVTARALKVGPPLRPVTPGVAHRLTMAWVLGTGVPAFGSVAVTSVALLGGELDQDRALAAALFLGVIALTVGLAAMLFASRSVAEPVVAMRGAVARVEDGDLQARVAVNDASEVGMLQAGFNRMTEGLAERERIRDAFGTYVDREVAEHILREGTSLAGEEVEVTMMFIDIRDFTGFSERHPAPEVVATVNRLWERAVPLITDHHGHVDKFVGDGLLAVFGAPRRVDDHADQALAAALEITEAVDDEFHGELSIGVGLNSGMVVAGNVGGGGRLEFSVIGDAVNVAARVEAATRKTGDVVLLAENVKRLLRDNAVPLEERPGVPLKGKTESIMLYAPSSPVPTGGEGKS